MELDLKKGRSRDLWGNLAGPPSHVSPSLQSKRQEREYHGHIKLRLAHSEGGSYLIPDVLIGVAGHRFYLPSFYSPPAIAFNVDGGRHIADFSLDVGPPRASSLTRLLVRVSSEDRVRDYEDGATLYRCTFKGLPSIASLATGTCNPTVDGDFDLRLYHHTTAPNAASIKGSQELWSSSWNLAGTRKLTNVAYGYFTSLPSVRDEEDLRRIAMASDGIINFQTTSDRPREAVLSLEVYRGNTLDRTSSLGFDVPCGIIAPAHLYFHSNVGANPAYFEIVGPEIQRVGVKPGAKLTISGSLIGVAPPDIKTFDYVVLGDAGTKDGLAAPYNEEETKQIAHLERLNATTDFFGFWWDHRNSDQVTGHTFEARTLEPRR
jgi:hypothetical protein